MKAAELRMRIPVSELIFVAVRSKGPGGQNVNKVSTKVEVRFNVLKSPFLSEKERITIMTILKNRITTDGELIIISQSERTQLANRRNAEEKFYCLLSEALTEFPERKATSPTKISKTERLENKKKHGNIKKLRKSSGFDIEGM